MWNKLSLSLNGSPLQAAIRNDMQVCWLAKPMLSWRLHGVCNAAAAAVMTTTTTTTRQTQAVCCSQRAPPRRHD